MDTEPASLARISYQPPAADADPTAGAALDAAKVLSTYRQVRLRAPRLHEGKL